MTDKPIQLAIRFDPERRKAGNLDGVVVFDENSGREVTSIVEVDYNGSVRELGTLRILVRLPLKRADHVQD